jgi:2-polyprenyl-3-methyl-5-hydroxy-6-metoxy-1,4-benzoquinol methylase
MAQETPAQVLERTIRELYGVPADADIDTLTEPLRSYVTYSLGTVDRGRWTLDELRPFGLKPGFRFFDAGCAYGGFLAAATEAGAREVAGVDVNEKYLRIARELLAAYGIPARVESGSLSDPNLIQSLGTFDLITCSDVIEHVDDVPATIKNLCQALAPGGLLYLAVPNARCPSFVRRDPHFQLFGITLLDPGPARQYSRCVSGTDYYDIGEFHTLNRYLELLRGNGLEADVINAPQDLQKALADLKRDVDLLEEDARNFEDSRLPEEMVETVREEALKVAAEIRREIDACGRGAWWRFWEEPVGPEGVLREFAIATWHFLGRKRG